MSPFGRKGAAGKPRRLLPAVLLGTLTALVGIGLAHWGPTETFELRGLDWLFILRGERDSPADVCVVALDEDAYSEFNVPPSQAWPRALHAQLIRTLKAEGARAVAFDVLFEGMGPDDESDGALASAIADTGIVVLGAEVSTKVDPRFSMAVHTEPYAPFAAGAAEIADVGLPTDIDGVIRRTWLMRGEHPSLALGAYEVATKDRSRRGRPEQFIDYYGPARKVRTVSYGQAFRPAELPPGFFKNKIVFVGLSLASAVGPAAKDAFPTPFRREDSPRTYGVEIHATVAGNLLENRTFDLLSPLVEAAYLLILSFAAVTAFLLLRPVVGVAALLGFEAAVWLIAYEAFVVQRLWLLVMIPSLIMLPLAYVAALVWYYLTTVRERERIRRAFNFYLSPEMIAKIVLDPSSLNLGGEEIVATALFTDVKGFTTIAESMPAPQTAAMLNGYFSDLTRSIFAEGGTLIKFIGDAVFAIWGAPLRMDDHRTRACTAALAMARGEEVSPSAGTGVGATAGAGNGGEPRAGSPVKLVTRIGVHTGPMLVGNLGSEQRFDYTAIGDAVNLAARLEGLNKYFGTRAMVSGATLSGTGDRFLVRRLGKVRVVGKTEPVEIFELVGERDGAAPGLDPVRARYEDALTEFYAGRFETAAEGFRQANASAPNGDGPSVLYREEALRLMAEPPPSDWDGTIVFEKK